MDPANLKQCGLNYGAALPGVIFEEAMTNPAVSYPIALKWEFPIPVRMVVCLFVPLILLALAGCSSGRGGAISYDVQEFGTPDSMTHTALEPDYRIAPLDKLAIQVFQVETLSNTYEVDLTGRIAMPLIGSVQAVDLTADELSELLEARYAERHLVDPEIFVGVAESRGSVLTLEGSVGRPGLYPVLGRVSLLQAIAMGGGVDDMGNPKRVAIFRQIEGQRMAAAFDLTTIRSGEDEDPAVYRGDIIVVDGDRARRSFRDVLQSLPIFNVFSPVY